MDIRMPMLVAVLLTCKVAAADAVLPTPAKPEARLRKASGSESLQLQRLNSSPQQATELQLAEQCQTGTLLFSRGDCLAVKACTGSRFTHVATIIEEADKLWVYDSTAGVGVRKLTLTEYLNVQAPDEVTVMNPHRPFTSDEAARFRSSLEAEIGRTYGFVHFLTGWENDGIHCAEYMTEALMAIGWLTAKKPGTVSPASLLQGIAEAGVYDPGKVYVLNQSLEPIPEVDGWCEELWQEMKVCCQGSCRQFSRWFLCR